MLRGMLFNKFFCQINIVENHQVHILIFHPAIINTNTLNVLILVWQNYKIVYTRKKFKFSNFNRNSTRILNWVLEKKDIHKETLIPMIGDWNVFNIVEQ